MAEIYYFNDFCAKVEEIKEEPYVLQLGVLDNDFEYSSKEEQNELISLTRWELDYLTWGFEKVLRKVRANGLVDSRTYEDNVAMINFIVDQYL